MDQVKLADISKHQIFKSTKVLRKKPTTRKLISKEKNHYLARFSWEPQSVQKSKPFKRFYCFGRNENNYIKIC